MTAGPPRTSGGSSEILLPTKKNGHFVEGEEIVYTVLLVEDHDQLLAIFCELFSLNGYRVLTASSGAEALAVAEVHGNSIDLLVSEVLMANMDGFELARRLTTKLPSLPVLLMSGAPGKQVAACGDTSAVSAFLRKPFRLRELLHQAQSALNLAGILEPIPGVLSLGNRRAGHSRGGFGSKGTTRFPTEQDIKGAVGRWQSHSVTEAETSEDHPNPCFCCGVVNALSDNNEFLAVLRSMLDHLETNEDGLLDVLLSVYAFGLLTGEVMREREVESAQNPGQSSTRNGSNGDRKESEG